MKDKEHLNFFKAPKIELSYPLTTSSRLEERNSLSAL